MTWVIEKTGKGSHTCLSVGIGVSLSIQVYWYE